MKNYPKLLSNQEIEFLESPDRAGYSNPSDKYDNISKKAEKSFGTIFKILEELTQIHHDSTKSKPIEKAKVIVDLYGNENVGYFVDSVFQKRDEINRRLEDFPKSVGYVKMESASLATSLMKICIKKLKETVGTGEYQWILTKTEELEKEINGVLESIREKKLLEYRIKDLEQYLENSDPELPPDFFTGIFASCLACNVGSQGADTKIAIQNIEHAKKCRYILSDNMEPLKTAKWIRTITYEDYNKNLKIIRELKNQEQSS